MTTVENPRRGRNGKKQVLKDNLGFYTGAQRWRAPTIYSEAPYPIVRVVHPQAFIHHFFSKKMNFLKNDQSDTPSSLGEASSYLQNKKGFPLENLI